MRKRADIFGSRCAAVQNHPSAESGHVGALNECWGIRFPLDMNPVRYYLGTVFTLLASQMALRKSIMTIRHLQGSR